MTPHKSVWGHRTTWNDLSELFHYNMISVLSMSPFSMAHGRHCAIEDKSFWGHAVIHIHITLDESSNWRCFIGMPVRCHMMSCKCTVVQWIKSSIGSYMSGCIIPLGGVWWSHSATSDKHSLNCLLISYIYNNSSLTTWREPLYNLRRIPNYIWLSNRRTPLFVADEYRRERIYFRYWEHCLFHWACCKYLLHFCLLFCFISSCKKYKHMHSYFMTLQIYIKYVTIIPPPHRLIESFKILNNDFTFDSTTLFPRGLLSSLVFSIIHCLLWQQSIYSL